MGRQNARAFVCTVLACCLLGSTFGSSAIAQTPTPAGPLTLDQVLQMAEQHSESIDIARAGIDRAAAEQLRAKSGRLPQLTAFASYDRALASEFSSVFENTGPTCPPFAADPLASAEARLAEIERAINCGAVAGSLFGSSSGSALPFGRLNTWRFNLSFTQSLYSGGRLAALATIASSGRESAELELTSARAQVLFDVTQAYYDAVLSSRVVGIAEAALRQAQATFEIVQAGYKAGTQPEFELLRARVARDNQAPAIIRQRASRDIALLRLKQLLELPADADLRLADTLESPTLPPPAMFGPRLAALEISVPGKMQPIARDGPLPDRTVVKEAAALVQLREASLRAARAEGMPSAQLTSDYGRVAYPNGTLPRFGDFRTNWTIGASVQFPLLNGGSVRAGEIVARAELQQSLGQMKQVSELAELDTRSASAQLVAARAVWEASAGTVEQASRAYTIAEVRYRAGVSTQLELSDSRLLLEQAEVNRAQAARDLQVARARMALLPDLPLGAGQSLTPSQAPQQTPLTPAIPSSMPASGSGAITNASTSSRTAAQSGGLR